MSDFSNNSELDIIIKEVKQELKPMFMKRKDLMVKLGNQFEKIVANPVVKESMKIVQRKEITSIFMIKILLFKFAVCVAFVRRRKKADES